MKKTIALFVAFFFSVHVFAQEDFQTIFDRDVSFSGYGGPFMSFTQINGEFAHMMGGGGGLIVSKSFTFGGFGIGSTTNHFIDYANPHSSIVYPDMDIEIGYGGLYVGYVFAANKPIHPAIYLQSGWGEVSLYDGDSRTISDNIFSLNPSLQLEMNMTKFFRIGLGVNYQYVRGVSLNGLSNEDFSSPGAFLSFKFGWFN